MERVNLFIVGAQKGGTTALADFLSQHPQVYIADGKEAHVFDDPLLQCCEMAHIDSAYQEYFSCYQGEMVRCDATPIYMYFKEIPERIFSYNPDARIIIILREPAERAFSQYQMEKRRGDEEFSFIRALLSEKKRLASDLDRYKLDSAHRLFSYRSRGCYFEQLQNIYSIFPKENVLVLSNNELRFKHKQTLVKVAHFLNISVVDIPAASVFSGNYKMTFSERLVTWALKFYFFPEKMRLLFFYKFSF
ncbi:TPA: sulfotransferase domain-containing protein [Aeromonas veronii]|nr:sulfotransferase domain-containing protein [Aeromonas veronii]